MMGYYSLERGRGVLARRALRILQGAEHTPANTPSGAPPLKRGIKKLRLWTNEQLN